MAGREFSFSLFGHRCKVRGPLIGDEEVREIQSYLEESFAKVLGVGSAKVVASKVIKDNALLPVLLKISWDYLKVKREMRDAEDTLAQGLDEALRLAEYMVERLKGEEGI